MDKWPYGDCLTFYSVMLCDDMLIENNKYGYVTMQNNGAMKTVNFTHVQMAETRRSFHHPWMLSTRLVFIVLLLLILLLPLLLILLILLLLSMVLLLLSLLAPPILLYAPPTSSFACSSYSLFCCFLLLLHVLSLFQDWTNRAVWVRCCTVSATSDRSHDNAQVTATWTIHPLGEHVG